MRFHFIQVTEMKITFQAGHQIYILRKGSCHIFVFSLMCAPLHQSFMIALKVFKVAVSD